MNEQNDRNQFWLQPRAAPLGQPRESTTVEMLREMIEDMAATAQGLADEAESCGIVLDFTDLDVQVLKIKQAIRKAWRDNR